MNDTTELSRNRWPAVLVAALIALVLAVGCTVVFHWAREHWPTVDGLAACGSAPHSRGAAASRVRLTVQAPADAPSGSTVRVVVRAVSLTGRAESIEGSPPSVLIVRHGRVVGRFSGAAIAIGIGLQVAPAGATRSSASVLLSGCRHGGSDATPDATRKPLRPGTYDLIATVSGPAATYVSRPVAIMVR